MATIEELLASLDLSKFVEVFKAQDIDLATARKLSDAEFKELGLTIGARKKLTEALMAGSAGGAAPAPAAATTSPPPPAPGLMNKAPAGIVKPTAAIPVTATPVDQAAGPATINACGFKWLNDAKRWPNGAPAKFERMHVADGPNPQVGVLSCRDEFNYVSVVNFVNGGQFKLTPKRTRGRRFDADIYGDIIVACGDDDDNVLDIYSLSGRKQTGEYHGPKEGGLSYMAIYTSGSGAVQVAASSYGKVFFYDVATAARCSKPIAVKECNARDMKRDPHNPTCVMAAYDDGGMLYIDTRAGKTVKQIYGMTRTDTIRLPYSNPGQGIVSSVNDPTRVFDIGMEKFIHTLGSINYYCSTLYKNVAVCYLDGFFFYDLAGAPEQIEEYAHDLRGGHANNLDIINGKLYATSWGSCYVMGV